MIVYRQLLLKYIAHVVEQVGMSFLGCIGLVDDDDHVYRGPFTEEEARELRKLDDIWKPRSRATKQVRLR